MSVVLERRAPSVGLTVLVARGPDALAAFGGDWDELVREQPVPNPTLGSVWLGGLMETDLASALVVRVEAGGRLLAGGAFVRRPLTRWGGPPVLTFPFDGQPPLTVPDILVARDQPQAGERVIDALRGEGFAVQLGPTPVEGAAAAAARASAPWSSVRSDPLLAWHVDVASPTLARQRRRVDYEIRRAGRAGATVAVRVAAEPAEIAAALERLFVLHRGRRGARDVARFSLKPADRDWHRRAVGAMAARGDARIVEVLEDGEPVAGLLLLLAGRGALLKTMGIRVGGHLKGPGNAAILSSLEEARDAGAEVVALGQGTGAHKERFHPDAVPLAHFASAATAGRQPALDAALVLGRLVWRVRR